MEKNEVLTIEQEKQLLELEKQRLSVQRNELALSELRNTSVIPKSMNGKLALAAQFSQSKLLPPAYYNQPENCFIALQYGEMLGFINPMSCFQNIYVIGNRPSASADSMLGAVFNQPEFVDYDQTIEYLDETFEYWIDTSKKDQKPNWEKLIAKDIKSTTKITKKMPNGKDKVFERYHKLSMSKHKLNSFPEWQNDPENMLKHRSDSKCCRSAFPQIFSGLHNPDETEDIVRNEIERQDGKGNIIGTEPKEDFTESILDK